MVPVKCLQAVGIDVDYDRVLYDDVGHWILLLWVFVFSSFPLKLSLEHFAGCLL
jgi:hypothetical protein